MGKLSKILKVHPENSESSSVKFRKSSQIRKVPKVRPKKKRSSLIFGWKIRKVRKANPENSESSSGKFGMFIWKIRKVETN